MANVQQEELFERFIPDVLIEKITLENSGFYPPEINPHIDNERENISKSKQNESLNIALNLVIKEKFSDDVIGQWISDIDLKKYLNIKVFQTTNKQISELLRISKDMFALVDPELRDNLKDSVKQIAKKFLRVSNDKMLERRLSKGITYKKVNLSEWAKSQNIYDNANIKKETNDDGTESYNIYYTIRFQIKESQPEHLSYFTIVTFDVDALSKKYNLQYSLGDSLNTSRVNTESVIESSETVSISYSYILSNGKIWTGEVHKNEEGNWRTGASETADSQTLTRLAVSNSKIQDFRNVKQIKKLQFDFRKINKDFEKLKISNISNLPKARDTRNYFSEILVSSDIDRDATISFDLNFKDLVISNSKFSNLISSYNSQIADDFVDSAKIQYLRIFRRRVKYSFTQANKATDQGGYQKFDKNEKEETICVTANFPGSRILRQVDNDTCFFSENRTRLYPSVRNIECTDKTTSELTDGLYQYGIEIEVSDPSIKYLLNKLRTLQSIKAKLERYYLEASKLSIARFYEEVSDPHISSPAEQSKVVGTLEGNYDDATNSFTETFKQRMSQQYPEKRNSPWVLAATIYPDILSIFIEDLDKMFVAEEILKIMSPYTGNPSGILAVTNLYNTLISAISSLLGVSDSVDMLGGKSSVGKPLKSFRVKHYFTNEVFDSDYDNVVGVEYFDESLIPSLARIKRPGDKGKKSSTKPKTGLIKIDGNQLQERADQETLKYFSSTQPDINDQLKIFNKDSIDNSSFSYFTPNKIVTYSKEYNIADPKSEINVDINLDQACDKDTTKKTDEALNNLRNITIATRGSSNATVASSKYEDLENNLKTLLAAVSDNSSVSIKLVSARNIDVENTPTVSSMAQNNDIPRTKREPDIFDNVKTDNGGFSSFINSITKDTDYTTIRSTTRSSEKSTYVSEVVSSNNKDRRISGTVITNNIDSNLSEERKKEIPNQLKAAQLASKGNSSVNPRLNIDQQSTGFELETRQQFDFNTISELQILSGYEVGENGKLLMNKPIWKKMDKEMYSTLPNDREVVARFVDYEDPTACGKKPNSIKDLKKLNDKFIIKPTTNIKTLPKKDTYSLDIDSQQVSIPKDLLDSVSKLVTEQATIPQKNMQTKIVNQKSIEQIANEQAVKEAVKQKEATKLGQEKIVDKFIPRK